MKHYLFILLLFISFKGYTKPSMICDTISNLKVYRHGKLIREGNLNSKIERITLTKGTISPADTLYVKYFDDTRCIECNSNFIITTENGKEIKTIKIIKNKLDNYSLKITTPKLQVMAFNNKSEVLKFYFKEYTNSKTIFLFEIEIK